MRPDSRRHGQSAPEDEDDFLEPPSKSSRKRDMHALQDLGEQLVCDSLRRAKALHELLRKILHARCDVRVGDGRQGGG